MNNELGSVYLGQLIAKQAIHQAQFGKTKTKTKTKKRSLLQRIRQKFSQ
ncbi:hypothetical protein KSS82_02945 [Vibrio mimicus]|nr:hypothetical protein [Vibrio mimicus]QXC55285.1 hypothetical protein KSS82_02945 [Vibrio mimicus]